MFGNSKYEYSVKTCPTDDPEKLETLLNTMSDDDWELYMLHEVDSRSGGIQYNCIFYKEVDEDSIPDNPEVVDVTDFKSRMEKILHPYDEPYEHCKGLQSQISAKQEEISRIKNLLDSNDSDIDHGMLNEEISTHLKELEKLKSELNEAIDPELMFDRINQDKLTVVISDELLYLVDSKKNGELISETVKLRQELADKLGYVIPGIRFTNLETLEANEYRIDVRGLKMMSGVVYPGYVRLYPGQSNINRKPKDAIEDVDPINNNQRVFWIEESKTQDFWERGLSPAQVITKNLEYVVCRYVNEILDYSDINHYIEIVGTQNLFLVENLMPDTLSLGDFRYILASLIREKISIKDITFIFEKLNDFAQNSLDKNGFLEQLRLALSRQICSNIADNNGNIYGIVITEELANLLSELVLERENASFYISKNSKINKLVKHIKNIIKESGYDISNIAIISPPFIRLSLFNLFEQFIPGLAVISEEEIISGFNLEIIESIKDN